MHTTSSPWRKGKGVQVSLWKRSFQIGICHKQEYLDEVDGTLASIQGRFLDIEPTKIGEW